MRFATGSGRSSGDVATHLHVSEDGDDIPGVLGRSSGCKELGFKVAEANMFDPQMVDVSWLKTNNT